MMYLLAFFMLILVSVGDAFVVNIGSISKPMSTTTTTMRMAPRFDGNKWVATSPDEEPAAGYPAYKTLLLHGPKPYITRVFQPDDYEQAVLKFMANDQCNRIEAQGNMDAYLRNPNDWAYNRNEADKRGVKYDYWTLRTGDLVKTLVWSGVVVWFFSSTAIQLTNEYILK